MSNMKKQIQIKEGFLSINICIDELVNSLCEDDLNILLDHASCHDKIIKNVSDQILTGWTELGSHGAKIYDESSEFNFPLSKAIREVANRSGEVAKNEISLLSDRVKFLEILNDELLDSKIKLERRVIELEAIIRNARDAFKNRDSK